MARFSNNEKIYMDMGSLKSVNGDSVESAIEEDIYMEMSPRSTFQDKKDKESHDNEVDKSDDASDIPYLTGIVSKNVEKYESSVTEIHKKRDDFYNENIVVIPPPRKKRSIDSQLSFADGLVNKSIDPIKEVGSYNADNSIDDDFDVHEHQCNQSSSDFIQANSDSQQSLEISLEEAVKPPRKKSKGGNMLVTSTPIVNNEQISEKEFSFEEFLPACQEQNRSNENENLRTNDDSLENVLRPPRMKSKAVNSITAIPMDNVKEISGDGSTFHEIILSSDEIDKHVQTDNVVAPPRRRDSQGNKKRLPKGILKVPSINEDTPDISTALETPCKDVKNDPLHNIDLSNVYGGEKDSEENKENTDIIETSIDIETDHKNVKKQHALFSFPAITGVKRQTELLTAKMSVRASVAILEGSKKKMRPRRKLTMKKAQSIGALTDHDAKKRLTKKDKVLRIRKRLNDAFGIDESSPSCWPDKFKRKKGKRSNSALFLKQTGLETAESTESFASIFMSSEKRCNTLPDNWKQEFVEEPIFVTDIKDNIEFPSHVKMKGERGRGTMRTLRETLLSPKRLLSKESTSSLDSFALTKARGFLENSLQPSGGSSDIKTKRDEKHLGMSSRESVASVENDHMGSSGTIGDVSTTGSVKLERSSSQDTTSEKGRSKKLSLKTKFFLRTSSVPDMAPRILKAFSIPSLSSNKSNDNNGSSTSIDSASKQKIYKRTKRDSMLFNISSLFTSEPIEENESEEEEVCEIPRVHIFSETKNTRSENYLLKTSRKENEPANSMLQKSNSEKNESSRNAALTSERESIELDTNGDTTRVEDSSDSSNDLAHLSSDVTPIEADAVCTSELEIIPSSKLLHKENTVFTDAHDSGMNNSDTSYPETREKVPAISETLNPTPGILQSAGCTNNIADDKLPETTAEELNSDNSRDTRFSGAETESEICRNNFQFQSENCATGVITDAGGMENAPKISEIVLYTNKMDIDDQNSPNIEANSVKQFAVTISPLEVISVSDTNEIRAGTEERVITTERCVDTGKKVISYKGSMDGEKVKINLREIEKREPYEACPDVMLESKSLSTNLNLPSTRTANKLDRAAADMNDLWDSLDDNKCSTCDSVHVDVPVLTINAESTFDDTIVPEELHKEITQEWKLNMRNKCYSKHKCNSNLLQAGDRRRIRANSIPESEFEFDEESGDEATHIELKKVIVDGVNNKNMLQISPDLDESCGRKDSFSGSMSSVDGKDNILNVDDNDDFFDFFRDRAQEEHYAYIIESDSENEQECALAAEEYLSNARRSSIDNILHNSDESSALHLPRKLSVERGSLAMSDSSSRRGSINVEINSVEKVKDDIFDYFGDSESGYTDDVHEKIDKVGDEEKCSSIRKKVTEKCDEKPQVQNSTTTDGNSLEIIETEEISTCVTQSDPEMIYNKGKDEDNCTNIKEKVTEKVDEKPKIQNCASSDSNPSIIIETEKKITGVTPFNPGNALEIKPPVKPRRSFIVSCIPEYQGSLKYKSPANKSNSAAREENHLSLEKLVIMRHSFKDSSIKNDSEETSNLHIGDDNIRRVKSMEILELKRVDKIHSDAKYEVQNVNSTETSAAKLIHDSSVENISKNLKEDETVTDPTDNDIKYIPSLEITKQTIQDEVPKKHSCEGSDDALSIVNKIIDITNSTCEKYIQNDSDMNFERTKSCSKQAKGGELNSLPTNFLRVNPTDDIFEFFNDYENSHHEKTETQTEENIYESLDDRQYFVAPSASKNSMGSKKETSLSMNENLPMEEKRDELVDVNSSEGSINRSAPVSVEECNINKPSMILESSIEETTLSEYDSILINEENCDDGTCKSQSHLADIMRVNSTDDIFSYMDNSENSSDEIDIKQTKKDEKQSVLLPELKLNSNSENCLNDDEITRDSKSRVSQSIIPSSDHNSSQSEDSLPLMLGKLNEENSSIEQIESSLVISEVIEKLPVVLTASSIENVEINKESIANDIGQLHEVKPFMRINSSDDIFNCFDDCDDSSQKKGIEHEEKNDNSVSKFYDEEGSDMIPRSMNDDSVSNENPAMLNPTLFNSVTVSDVDNISFDAVSEIPNESCEVTSEKLIKNPDHQPNIDSEEMSSSISAAEDTVLMNVKSNDLHQDNFMHTESSDDIFDYLDRETKECDAETNLNESAVLVESPETKVPFERIVAPLDDFSSIRQEDRTAQESASQDHCKIDEYDENEEVSCPTCTKGICDCNTDNVNDSSQIRVHLDEAAEANVSNTKIEFPSDQKQTDEMPSLVCKQNYESNNSNETGEETARIPVRQNDFMRVNSTDDLFDYFESCDDSNHAESDTQNGKSGVHESQDISKTTVEPAKKMSEWNENSINCGDQTSSHCSSLDNVDDCSMQDTSPSDPIKIEVQSEMLDSLCAREPTMNEKDSSVHNALMLVDSISNPNDNLRALDHSEENGNCGIPLSVSRSDIDNGSRNTSSVNSSSHDSEITSECADVTLDSKSCSSAIEVSSATVSEDCLGSDVKHYESIIKKETAVPRRLSVTFDLPILKDKQENSTHSSELENNPCASIWVAAASADDPFMFFEEFSEDQHTPTNSIPIKPSSFKEKYFPGATVKADTDLSAIAEVKSPKESSITTCVVNKSDTHLSPIAERKNPEEPLNATCVENKANAHLSPIAEMKNPEEPLNATCGENITITGTTDENREIFKPAIAPKPVLCEDSTKTETSKPAIVFQTYSPAKRLFTVNKVTYFADGRNTEKTLEDTISDRKLEISNRENLSPSTSPTTPVILKMIEKGSKSSVDTSPDKESYFRSAENSTHSSENNIDSLPLEQRNNSGKGESKKVESDFLSPPSVKSGNMMLRTEDNSLNTGLSKHQLSTFVKPISFSHDTLLDAENDYSKKAELLLPSYCHARRALFPNVSTSDLGSLEISDDNYSPRSLALGKPTIILQTWLERQDSELATIRPARSTSDLMEIIMKKLDPPKSATVMRSASYTPRRFRDTPSPGTPVDHYNREEPAEEDLPPRQREHRQEERVQKDRSLDVYPETLRQRQRSMAPSPSKVDIKNWNQNSPPVKEASSPAAGKKFLPSVRALRNQFESGKNLNSSSNGSVSPTSTFSMSSNNSGSSGPHHANLGHNNSSSRNEPTSNHANLSRKLSGSSLASSSLEKSSSNTSLNSAPSTENLLDGDLHNPEEPVEPIFCQFQKVDEELRELMSRPTSTTGWDPRSVLERLYFVPEIPRVHSKGHSYTNIEGYLEKLPSGRKKATFWNAWKKRYFVAKDGVLYYYQNSQCEKASLKLTLMGGKVETMDGNMVGVDDGKGHYVVMRCSSRQEAERWRRALETHLVEDFASQYVQPVPLTTNPTLLRDTLIIDIGSCSIRAGVLTSQATLPQVFFPAVLATDRETQRQIWGQEALTPQTRSTASITFPMKPSHRISKYSVDLTAVTSLLVKTFSSLKVDPKNYNLQLSVPRVLNQHTQSELLRILFEKFGVKGVNVTHQSILALYAYNATSGIVVDIGERMDIVPVIDGYIVEGGVSRVPYGGSRILDHLRQFMYLQNVSLVNDVESYLIRHVLETACYCAQHYNTEKARCSNNPENFEKVVSLAEFFPSHTKSPYDCVELDFGRFQATEGLFNPDAWGLDHPGLHKLVHKAIQECSMDIRKEMSRSIFLAGGVTQLPGFADRLTTELDNLTPPAIRPKVHISPYRYHAAYIGACTLAESPAFSQTLITKDNWSKNGNAALRKWAL